MLASVAIKTLYLAHLRDFHFGWVIVVHGLDAGDSDWHLVCYFNHVVCLMKRNVKLRMSIDSQLTDAFMSSCGEPFFFESLRITSEAWQQQ
jgi:hypothetical protein